MNGDLAPAVVAAAGGGALLAGITAHEYRRDAAMRRSRQALSLTFPVGVPTAAALDTLSTLAGLDHPCELVAEAVASEDGIGHLLHVPASVAPSVTDQLRAGLPGLRAEEVLARSTGPIDVAVRILAGERTLLRTDQVEAASRALLGGLAALRSCERLSLRWALRPTEIRGGNSEEDRPATSLRTQVERRGHRARIGQPAFQVRGLLLVRAGSRVRAKELAEHVLGVLRSRRGVGSGLMFRRGRVQMDALMPRTGRGRGGLTASELLPLLGWPIGSDVPEGVTVGASRQLAIPRGLARVGRQLLIGRDAYGERPVALTPEAGLHHLAVVGPSGVGKSVLLARGVLDQMSAGFGGVVLDPKADLVETILARVPAEHAHRVVVLDPATAGPVPGLDLLSGGDPDLRADVVVGAFSAIFARVWGVRSDYYVRLAVRTIADIEGATLADAGRLLIDPGYRRGALDAIQDPFTRTAWQAFEGLPVAEQLQHVQAPVARIMALLSRPAVRSILAAPDPKLNVERLLAERKWLLVSLSPGRLGEPAARLISSLVLYGVWSAIEARAVLPPHQRHPVFVTVDELATLATLPVSFELLAERARGLGAGLTVATQTLGRLPDTLRASLLGNVASLVSFRAGAIEAPRLAAELPGLTAQDLMALRRFEVAARVGTGVGSSVATVTGHTEPLEVSTGQAQAIRERSAREYGSVASTEAPARPNTSSDEAFGRSRRRA